VIVSPRVKLSLLMFMVTDAFGALNDLNSGKTNSFFLEYLEANGAKISCCLRIQIGA